MRVTISAGHTNLHFLRTASSAQRASLLERYITSLYAGESELTGPSSVLLRGLLGRKRYAKLTLHHLDGLDPKVSRLLTTEVLARVLGYGAAKLPGSKPSFRNKAFLYPMLLYGWLSQRKLGTCDVLHVRSGYGRFAMDRARRGGATCVVDHSIADSDHLFSIQDQERQRWSSGEDSLQTTGESFRAVDADLAEADHVLVNSNFVKQTLIHANRVESKRITVVEWGVDTQAFTPIDGPRPREPFTILFVGKLDFRKGALYLLEAVRRLRLRNARVVLIGNKANIPLEPYQGYFEHIANIPQTYLPNWYRAASVFVFPSLAEGSARVVFEAMASGIPVITTAESGSVIRDGVEGFIVPSRQIEALQDRILQLYLNPDQSDAMGVAGRRRVLSEFTWDHYGGRLLRFYKSIDQGCTITPRAPWLTSGSSAGSR